MSILIQKLFYHVLPTYANGIGGLEDTEEITTTFNELLGTVYGIALAVLGSTALIWGLLIFIKFATAQGDERKIKEAKDALKQFFIGIIALIVIVAIFPPLITWALSGVKK